jgi:hypothetical protein
LGEFKAGGDPTKRPSKGKGVRGKKHRLRPPSPKTPSKVDPKSCQLFAEFQQIVGTPKTPSRKNRRKSAAPKTPSKISGHLRVRPIKKNRQQRALKYSESGAELVF